MDKPEEQPEIPMPASLPIERKTPTSAKLTPTLAPTSTANSGTVPDAQAPKRRQFIHPTPFHGFNAAMNQTQSIPQEATDITTVRPQKSLLPPIDPDASDITTIRPQKSLLPPIGPEVSDITTVRPQKSLLPPIDPEASDITTVRPQKSLLPPIDPEATDITTIRPQKLTIPLAEHQNAADTTDLIEEPITPQVDEELSQKRRWALFALIVASIGVFFTALDQTVVVTALPQITTDLHIPITQLDHAAWIVSAYLLGFVIAMPLMGRVSDLYGRRRIFLLCLFLFGLGSFFCAIAPTLGATVNIQFLAALHIDTSSPGLIWLITARLIQAIGGGAVVPVSMAIASDFYGQEKRGLALGIIGAVTEAGGALGPLYGAFIVQRFGWQYIFYLNIPIVIVLAIMAWFLLPKGPHLQEGIDWLGTALLAATLTCLSLGLAQQGSSLQPVSTSQAVSQSNPLTLILALIFFIAFIVVEQPQRWPIIELDLFRRYAFSASSLVSLLVGAALITALADIPIFVDTVLQWTVIDSGLALLRLTVMIPIGAILGGWLCGRISCRITGVLGLILAALGFYLMSLWPVNVGWTQITEGTVVAGFGFGLVISPISTTAINAVRSTQAGMSSAIVTALRMVGMILGLAILTSWALSHFRELAGSYPAMKDVMTGPAFVAAISGYTAYIFQSARDVYTTVFFIAMCMCLLAIIPSFFLWGRASEFQTHSAFEEPFPPAAQIAPVNPEAHRFSNPRKFVLAGLLTLAFIIIVASVIGSINTPPTQAASNNTHTMKLALDKAALTSVFTQQLQIPSGIISGLTATPEPHDGLNLNFTLHINLLGLQRALPVELDCRVGLDKHKNIQLTVLHVKRDGIDAGPLVAAQMQTAVNQMIASAVMPALHSKLTGVTLLSVYTDTTIGCGNKGEALLVLQANIMSTQGLDIIKLPQAVCFLGTIDLKNILP
jgi:EmrB/QacA subfamily drug resistance transporter